MFTLRGVKISKGIYINMMHYDKIEHGNFAQQLGMASLKLSLQDTISIFPY